MVFTTVVRLLALVDALGWRHIAGVSPGWTGGAKGGLATLDPFLAFPSYLEERCCEASNLVFFLQLGKILPPL